MVEGSKCGSRGALLGLQSHKQFGQCDAQGFGDSNERREPQIFATRFPEPNDGPVDPQELAERILRVESLFDAKFTNALTETALDVSH